jgi:hypothetical protein
MTIPANFAAVDAPVAARFQFGIGVGASLSFFRRDR